MVEIAHSLMRAKYDAAQTTADNRNHWINADNLSARAANDPATRARLRQRSRYEVANNSWARGMVLTLANDTIGSGPRPQMLGADKTANRVIEKEFLAWAKTIDLAGKLRTMRMAKVQDGETFAVLTNNPELPTRVKLDIRLIEADQVASPAMTLTGADLETEVDGIKFDSFGNPISYSILRNHPGGDGFATDARNESAQNVIHWFRSDRPGQARAVPELTAALPLFALLRDFTLATLDAAKLAAMITAVIKSNGSADSSEGESVPFTEVDIPRNTMLTLPDGYGMEQFRSEHPTSTFVDFTTAILNEIARCLNMPLNVAMANSARYNYASGRMDHQVYFKSIQVERMHIECVVLDRIFAAWLDEALKIENYLNVGVISAEHAWFWDGREHVDPAKEANAQETRIGNGTSHRPREYALLGLDCDEQDEIAATSYGITVAEYRKALFVKQIGQAAAQAKLADATDPQDDTDPVDPADAEDVANAA